MPFLETLPPSAESPALQGFMRETPTMPPPAIAGNGTMAKLSKVAIRQNGKWRKVGSIPLTGGVMPTG